MEYRFYIKHQYFCPRCGLVLEWRSRSAQEDSFKLRHPEAACILSGREFHAPVLHFTEMRED